MRAADLFVLACWLLCFIPSKANAHPQHLTSITVHLDDTETRVTATAHVAHLAGMPPETAIPARLRLRLDGVLFRPSETSVDLSQTGETITWQGRERRAASRVSVDSPLFPDSFADPTVVLVYRNGHIVDRAVIDREAPSAILAESRVMFLWRFIRMGIHHIVLGLDHVLFVLGLLLLRRSLGGLLAVVSAFTVAHSLTLSLTALDICSLPARLVEPLIALSIVAVGTENLLSRNINLERRIWLAFGFGFFHGFGFAGALREAAVPHDSVAAALAAFNIGAELGQACIVLLAVPVLRFWEQRNAVLTRTVTQFASLGIATAGVLWFVERLRL